MKNMHTTSLELKQLFFMFKKKNKNHYPSIVQILNL